MGANQPLGMAWRTSWRPNQLRSPVQGFVGQLHPNDMGGDCPRTLRLVDSSNFSPQLWSRRRLGDPATAGMDSGVAEPLRILCRFHSLRKWWHVKPIDSVPLGIGELSSVSAITVEVSELSGPMILTGVARSYQHAVPRATRDPHLQSRIQSKSPWTDFICEVSRLQKPIDQQ